MASDHHLKVVASNFWKPAEAGYGEYLRKACGEHSRWAYGEHSHLAASPAEIFDF